MYEDEKDSRNDISVAVDVVPGTRDKKAVVMIATHNASSKAMARELNCRALS